jgi:hypothetical protein
LSELFTEFLAGSRPVVSNTVAELVDVALEVELVLLEPGDVEFLSGGAAVELTGDVFLIVTNDPGLLASF